VGDMALFMLVNGLTPEQVLDPKRDIAFPESVVEFFEGKLGLPPGGFPPALQAKVLRGRMPLTERAGLTLPPADFEATARLLEAKLHRTTTRQDVVTSLLYSKVFAEFVEHEQAYSDVGVLPTPAFFFGLEKGEEVSIEIEPGKTLIVKFLTVGDPQPDGKR